MISRHLVLAVKRTKYGTAHVVGVRQCTTWRHSELERCESLDEQLAVAMMPQQPAFKYEEAELHRRAVYELPDWELVARLKQARTEALNPWEQNFCRGISEFFTKRGRITWGQRKYARRIVEKLEKGEEIK